MDRRRPPLMLVFLGGAIGTGLRALADVGSSDLPVATLAVNVAGSALLGYLVGRSAERSVHAFAGLGIAGAMTTFSTVMVETVELGWGGPIYLGLSILLGLAVARLSLAIGGGR